MRSTAANWEYFLREWDEVFEDQSWDRVSEATVSGSFAGRLLDLLDWRRTERAFAEPIPIKVGSKALDNFYPDIVLVPSSLEAKTLGHVFAVIELKRPGKADDDGPRMQARFYADHLRAPVYAVIDGERIRVWRRRLVDEDEEELNVRREEFASRFDEIRMHLGRSELMALRAELRRAPDEVGEARKRVSSIDHFEEAVRLRLEDGRVWASCSREQFLNADRWWGRHTPDARNPRLRLSVAGAFDDWMEHAPALIEAVTRIALHSDQVRLAVDEQDRWDRELQRVTLNLEPHHAAGVPRWSASRLDPDDASNDLGSPATLAEELHAALDTWARAAVMWRKDAVLAGRPEAPEHWAHGDVCVQLESGWDVSVRWLTSALRAGESDRRDARIRFGPRMVPYLLDVVLFPAAVAKVLGCLQPASEPRFSRNLEYTGASSVHEIGFAYALAEVQDFVCDAFLLVLSCSSLTPAMVRPAQRIGAPPEALRTHWHIGERRGGVVCCLSDDAKLILAKNGWNEFEKHLREKIQEQLGPHEGDPCPSTPLISSTAPSTTAGVATTGSSRPTSL